MKLSLIQFLNEQKEEINLKQLLEFIKPKIKEAFIENGDDGESYIVISQSLVMLDNKSLNFLVSNIFKYLKLSDVVKTSVKDKNVVATFEFKNTKFYVSEYYVYGDTVNDGAIGGILISLTPI